MDFEIGFTDKDITPWGGMALMKKMLDHCDIDSMFSSLGLSGPGSNRGYKPEDIIKSFLVSVWCGANRFMHTEVTRQDAVIRKIFGWNRICGQDTYKRFFSKFTQEKNQQVFTLIYQWFFQNLRFDNYTLDLDSSVLTRYGDQEGARVGYNAKKPGRKSHHPLMAFVADCRMIANVWLRSGNAHSANNLFSFLEDTLHKLQGKKVGLLRGDSGFYGKRSSVILRIGKKVQYLILSRLVCMGRSRKRFPGRKSGGSWTTALRSVKRNIKASTVQKPAGWSSSVRRFRIVRKRQANNCVYLRAATFTTSTGTIASLRI